MFSTYLYHKKEGGEDMRKKLCYIAVCLLLTFLYAVPVSGSDIMDMERECAVTMELKTEAKEALANGSFKFYQIGEVESFNQGKFTYRYLEDFQISNVTLNIEGASENEKSARELSNYAKKYKIPGETYVTDEDGIVRIAGLKPGLYLVDTVYQEKEVGKVEFTKPFLACIPEYENGELIFDVTIKTKVSNGAIPMTPLENSSKKPVKKPSGTHPGGSKLPQTGMLRWPIPVLALAGMILMEVGWYDGYVRKKK